MINFYFLFFLTLVLSFEKAPKIENKILFLAQNECKLNIQNGTIILINNGTCNGLCGTALNKFLIKNIPLEPKDSVFFIITNSDKNLTDTLNLFSNSMISKCNFSTLNKYDIYKNVHYAVRIKEKKIIKFVEIKFKTLFNNWFI
jgi:hypothetical protein